MNTEQNQHDGQSVVAGTRKSPSEANGPSKMERPSESFLLADIDRSIEYRKDYYKYALGIATALLAFTITFPPSLSVPPEYMAFQFLGWAGLGVAVGAGVRIHMVWSKFFASFQKFDNKGLSKEGNEIRSDCNFERRLLEKALMGGLVVGVVGVILFTGINLKNIAVGNNTIQIVQPVLPPASSAAPGP